MQFDTFDTLGDRRELVILFQRLGAGIPEALAREARAQWLESLIAESKSITAPLRVNPDACHPIGAYSLFIQIVGVLGVPIRVAAKKLDAYVTRGIWFPNKSSSQTVVK